MLVRHKHTGALFTAERRSVIRGVDKFLVRPADGHTSTASWWDEAGLATWFVLLDDGRPEPEEEAA